MKIIRTDFSHLIIHRSPKKKVCTLCRTLFECIFENILCYSMIESLIVKYLGFVFDSNAYSSECWSWRINWKARSRRLCKRSFVDTMFYIEDKFRNRRYVYSTASRCISCLHLYPSYAQVTGVRGIYSGTSIVPLLCDCKFEFDTVIWRIIGEKNDHPKCFFFY